MCEPELHDDRAVPVSCSSKSLISPYARIQSASAQKPSTRSTSTRPYQERSKIVDPAAARDVAPEAPEVRLRALLVGRRGDRDDVVLARVERRR